MEAKLRGFFTGILGVLSAWLGVLAVPVYMLVLCNLIDYLTGIAAAWKRGETISSYTGIQGIAKKISMWLLIGVGSIIDWLLLYAGNALHMEIICPWRPASDSGMLIATKSSLFWRTSATWGFPFPVFWEKWRRRCKKRCRGNQRFWAEVKPFPDIFPLFFSRAI